MKKLKVLALAAGTFLCLNGMALAQDTATQSVTMTINEICVLDVTGGTITLTVVPPATGGQTPSNPTDNTTRLQYTSTVGSAKTRSLQAKWGGSDVAPAGCSLKIQATTSGGTNEGTSGSQITVSDTDQTIATAIGSCATGTGGTYGTTVAYTLSIDTLTSLVAAESKSVTITFTMTDDV